jgi:hypothetical protein
MLFVGIPFLILPIWFAWVALDRAGLPGALSLLTFVPFGIVIVLGILAFAKWPNIPRPARPQWLRQAFDLSR